MELLFLLMALLALAGGIAARRRVRRRRDRGLTDRQIRRIEEEGSLRLDEPPDPDAELDLEEIRDEEDRFWSQTWDEPEPL